MKRKFHATVAVIAAGVALAATMINPAVSQTPGPNDRQISVFAPDEGSRGGFVDVGKKSFSVGDADVLRTQLVDPSSREKRGKFVIHCTWVAINFQKRTHRSMCEGTATFPEGRVAFYGGPVKFAGPGTVNTILSITGGTGEYEHVRGTVTAIEVEDGIDLGFDLRLE